RTGERSADPAAGDLDLGQLPGRECVAHPCDAVGGQERTVDVVGQAAQVVGATLHDHDRDLVPGGSPSLQLHRAGFLPDGNFRRTATVAARSRGPVTSQAGRPAGPWRGVATKVTAPTTGTPTARSARVASTKLAPVVTRSSHSTTA